MKRLLPKIYQKDIYSINYKSLKKNGYTSLFFDMDNTLIDNKTNTPSEKLLDLFNNLKKEDFKIFIISNSLPRRLNTFIQKLNITGSIPLACKPLKRGYKKLIKEYDLNYKEIACIGDQLYTDILGANKLNLLSILVDPISTKEHPLTKLNRLKENKIYKENLKRGEYYE